MLFTISCSKSVYPITPVDLLKAALYDCIGISVYFAYFILIKTKNKLTYDIFKARNSDSACSITLCQVLLKLFILLINTADKEIYNIYQ